MCPLGLLVLDTNPFGLFLQKIGIIAFIAINGCIFHFQHFVAHQVKKIAVMGNHQQGNTAFGEILFEPFDHLYIKMVGRFIQDQKSRFGNQRFCKGYPFALSARQLADLLIKIRQPELG